MENKSFLKNLEIVVEAIKNNSDLELLNFEVNKPASDSSIKDVSDQFFSGKENSLVKFYTLCNGLQLIWSKKGDKNANIDFYPLLFLKRDVKFQGVINLLPVEIAFSPDQWKDTIWFEDDSARLVDFIDGTQENKGIKRKLFPIDYFSVDMSVSVYPASSNNYMLLLQDYHIDYSNSFLTLWEEYLDFLILTSGDIMKRYRAFNKLSGHRHPPLSSKQLLENL